MSTTQQLTVYKGYPTKITIKADGYNDYKTTKTFTTAGETVNIPSTEMTAYDGLDYSFSTADNNLYSADFSDTTLPNGNTPSPTLYAMKASGQTYPIPSSTPVYDNYTIVGSPTVNTSTGVVSGFSNSNYLTIDDNPNFQDANSWEFITKVSVGSTSQKILFGYGINFGVTNLGYLHLWLYNNGSQFIDSNVCSASLLTTNPFIKLSFDGTTYSCYISPDGETWTLKYSYNSTTKLIDNGPFTLGKDGYGSSEYWQGSIDLSQTYIKVNNSIWWEADSHPYVQIEGCLYNYTDDGSAVTLNAYQTGTSIILTPDVSYNGIKLGTVNVPEHTVSGE